MPVKLVHRWGFVNTMDCLLSSRELQVSEVCQIMGCKSWDWGRAFSGADHTAGIDQYSLIEEVVGDHGRREEEAEGDPGRRKLEECRRRTKSMAYREHDPVRDGESIFERKTKSTIFAIREQPTAEWRPWCG
jgi:hypothetical protein